MSTLVLPSTLLVAPVVETSIPQTMDDTSNLTSNLSASHWFTVAFDTVTGIDLEEVTKSAVSGDWEVVGRFASALQHLSEYLGAYGGAIEDSAKAVIKQTWTGHAAEKADVWFGDFASAVSALEPSLADLAGSYRDAAAGLREAGEGAVNYLEGLVDAIAGAPAILVTTVLAIVGAPVGVGEVAAVLDAAEVYYEAETIVKLIVETANAIGTMLTWVQVISGLVVGYLSLLQTLGRNLDLPGVGYDHPGV